MKDQPYEDDNEAEVFEMEAQKLEKVMDMIPGEDKALLIMKYEQSMSIREISEILDKTESAVKMKIKRAKEKAKILSNMIMNVLVLFLWKIMM